MTTSRPRAPRLNTEALEDRSVPAALTYVNDNWHLFNDADNSGGLSLGDLVSSSNDGTLTVYQYGTQAFGTVTSGAGISGPTSLSGFATINNAVAAAGAGGTVNLLAGTYDEDVTLNQAGLSLIGAGPTLSVVRGAIGGATATVTVGASNVTVAGLTITRQGNTLADWTDPGLNLAGVAIQGQAVTGTVVRDNILTGNRTAVDVNNSNGNTVRNNVVTGNHTGLVFRNRTDDTTVTENAITNNRTVGVLFLVGTPGTTQSAADSTFFNNNISGNWYAQIVDRQSGASIPAPGTTNLKDFSGNWFGTTTPVVTTANSAEPGYADLIPVEFGGTAAAPGGQPDVAGPASANFDLSPLLGTGTDTDVETAPGRGTFGFQGNFASLVVTAQLAQTGTTGRVQEGVNRVTAGGTVDVQAGTYVENVTINKNLTLRSTDGRDATTIQGVSGVNALGTVFVTNNTSGVTIGGIGRGFTVIGIDNNNPGLENAAVYFQGNHTGARVIGNDVRADGDHGLLTEYGATISDFVIDGNIFSGQTFTGAAPATGDQFTVPNVARQLVVMGGGGGAAAGNTTNITFTNNQITGTAGAGGVGNSLVTLDAAGSTITGNTFAGSTAGSGAALRVRRPGTTISGNTFDGTNMAAGTKHLIVQNNASPLQAIVADNTFDRGTYVDGATDVSVSLADGAAAAAGGSTLHVLPGTYAEDLDLTAAGLNKGLTLSLDAGGPVTIDGNLALDADDTLVLAVDGGLNVTGTVALSGAALAPVLEGTVPPGAVLVLVDNGGAGGAGTFAGLAEGSVIGVRGQSFTISYTGGDGNDITLTAPAAVTAPPSDVSGVSPSAPTEESRIAVPLGDTGSVLVLDASGTVLYLLSPFGPLGGAVSAATGDLNGDGVQDAVVGGAGRVKVFDGSTGRELATYAPFTDAYTGGLSVAVGDLDGDGDNDIVVGALALAPLVTTIDFRDGTSGPAFFTLPVPVGVVVFVADVDGAPGAETIVVSTSGPLKAAVFNARRELVASFGF